MRWGPVSNPLDWRTCVARVLPVSLFYLGDLLLHEVDRAGGAWMALPVWPSEVKLWWELRMRVTPVAALDAVLSMASQCLLQRTVCSPHSWWPQLPAVTVAFLIGSLRFWPCSWIDPGLQQSPVLNTLFSYSANSAFSDWASSPANRAKTLSFKKEKFFFLSCICLPNHSSVHPSTPGSPYKKLSLSPCVSALRLGEGTQVG